MEAKKKSTFFSHMASISSLVDPRKSRRSHTQSNNVKIEYPKGDRDFVSSHSRLYLEHVTVYWTSLSSFIESAAKTNKNKVNN